MNSRFALSSGAVLAYAVAAGPAMADLSAQDVWSDWRNYLSGVGYEISASEAMSGNTLTVSDITMAMSIAESEGSMSLSADKIEFRENGDGTVAIILPASMPMRFEGSDGNEEFAMQINLDQTGHTMTASGSPSELTYAYAAASMAVNLASLMVDDKDMSGHATIQATLTNVASTTNMTVADMRSYQQRMTSDGVAYSFVFDDPESDDGGTMTGNLAGLAFQGSGVIPTNIDTSDVQKMLKAGFAFDGGFTYTSGQTDLSGTGEGNQFQFASTSQGGELNVAMNSSTLMYGVSQKQTSLNVAGSEIPIPIALQMAETGFHLLLPVAKSDAEQDFEFSFKLGDFTMSDMIWGMFDPSGALPRDPATIAVDLAGKVKVLVDFLAADMAEQMGGVGGPPGELNALTVKSLLISAIGAQLSGTGDFKFDNTDLQTFNGMPRPSGTVDLKLVGANGVIDKLIQMGLMSDQDAMGARMMMGMLAVPGDGEDTLTSKIEMNDQGHIIANGQRIQ